MSERRTFKLTQEIVAAHAGSAVVCIDARAIGHKFGLHAERLGASHVQRITWSGLRGEVIGAEGSIVTTEAQNETSIQRVDIRGPIEQRAGYADECGGWSDGHDAIAERMIAALVEGDVLIVIDSPGGAHAGLQEAVKRVVDAKAAYGRTVYAYADEMIGSAAYWWAAAIADAIYAPESGIVGSIGARASHMSIAGALAQDGIAPTYFAWPGEGKVAFAPELPLSDLGKQRGERDVSLAGEAFAAAVSAGRGISRDDIVALDADALSGAGAVAARLIDDIASLDEVTSLLLAQSEATAAASAAA